LFKKVGESRHFCVAQFTAKGGASIRDGYASAPFWASCNAAAVAFSRNCSRDLLGLFL
jgi:hypothetical protein